MAFRALYDGLSEGQQQFLKFSFVGGVGFVTDAGTFTILTKLLGLDLITGRVISSLVFGMTATYLLNRYLTFRNQRSGSILKEYLRFAAANIIGNLLNIGTHALLVENLALFHRLPILGIVAGTAVGLVFNFTGSKYFVFRAAKNTEL
jgi:putative flippase GtrA